MSEALQYPNSINDNGDVGIDPEAMERPLFISGADNRYDLFNDHPYYAITAPPSSRDATPQINPLYVAHEKRLHLLNAVKLIGRSNRAQGATMRDDIEDACFGGDAAAHAKNFAEKARSEIEMACALCAVRGLCSIGGTHLQERLKENATTRCRLKGRLTTDMLTAQPDTITCERYMAKNRITISDR